MNIYQQHMKQHDDPNYEIFNFEYTGPLKLQFDRDIYEEYQQELSEVPPEYLENYNTKDDDKFILYKVEIDDSIFGLELKFNINAAELLRINNISESSLYPGMVLKIPSLKQKIVNPVPIIIKQRSDTYLGVNLMDEIMQAQSQYYDVSYITPVGAIKGIFTVHSDVFFFDPDINDKENLRIVERAQLNHVTVFQTQILLKHVSDITLKSLPARITDHSLKPYKESIIQIHLQTKTQKLIYFKIELEKEMYKFMDAIKVALKDYTPQTPNAIMEQPCSMEMKTILPYYFECGKHQEQELYQAIQNMHTSQTYIAELESNSDIITQEYFMYIVCHIPIIYKSQGWKPIYSTILHGSSILTLTRKCEFYQPVILIIRDLDNYIFGAYFSEGIRMTRSFLGSGESFLFTFKNNWEFQVYEWTQNNNYFYLCDTDGLAVGCGDKYGLYLNQDLSQGYSTKCETFNNEQLTKKQNYIVDRLEIWGLVNQ